MTLPTSLSRSRGALLGLACGDAVGTAVEFKPRGTFPPISDMVGGGLFGLQPGQWTDDTSMALCLATSLLARNGFDPQDQMARYVRWYQEGYLSSQEHCFDIGNTVRGALHRFLQSGEPYSGSTDPKTAGNGSIMRLAPVPLFYGSDLAQTAHYSGESSRTTHATAEAVDGCRLFGVMIALALQGSAKEQILFEGPAAYLDLAQLAPAIAELARGRYRALAWDDLRGSGYVVESLQAALWCFLATDDFGAAILRATNLGDDADTTAAVCGQLAGAYYGIEGIPTSWLAQLTRRAAIQELADRLHARRMAAATD